MRRLLLFLMLVLALTACEDEVVTGNVADALNDSLENAEVVIDSEPERENLSQEVEELSDRDLLSKLKGDQQELFMKRAEVMKEKREVLSNLNDRDNSFEDRQFYQKAFDIVKQQESELDLEITILESKIRALDNKVEAEESLDVYREDLDKLKQHEDIYEEELREVGIQILEKRQEWMKNYDESVKKELKLLESEENEVLADLQETREQIKETEAKVEGVDYEELPEDYEEQLVRREGILEELNVVRNDLVEAYIALKSAADEEKETFEKLIDELEEKENQVEDKLREFNEEMNG